jgi:peroxiredoxin
MNAGNSQQRQAKNGRYIQGDMAPDIVMNDPNGQTRKLSDLRGKVVLLDFWASWCGPCRRENPNVVRAYEKYKDRGFEIFSVSLDSDAGKWQRAIEQDQLTWPNHVCDMRGWRNEAAQAYGISSIPHTMLIDRDGSVLATHLRGAMLESALRGVLGE